MSSLLSPARPLTSIDLNHLNLCSHTISEVRFHVPGTAGGCSDAGIDGAGVAEMRGDELVTRGIEKLSSHDTGSKDGKRPDNVGEDCQLRPIGNVTGSAILTPSFDVAVLILPDVVMATPFGVADTIAAMSAGSVGRSSDVVAGPPIIAR